MSDSSSRQVDLLAKKLDEIEAELKRAGYWSEEEIDPFESLPMRGTRSFLTASSFQAWLQLVFLPKARAAVRNRELPRGSQVGLMALRQWDYHSYVPEAQQLVRLLNEFDSLINSLTGAT